jgi:hypothetical protein
VKAVVVFPVLVVVGVLVTDLIKVFLVGKVAVIRAMIVRSIILGIPITDFLGSAQIDRIKVFLAVAGILLTRSTFLAFLQFRIKGFLQDSL